MNVMQYYSEIAGTYPEYVTQQQFFEICGIGKSTAYKLQKQGVIPYEIVVKRLLHTHRIRLTDVLEYKYKQEREGFYDEKLLHFWQQFYKQRLKVYHDVIFVKDIEAITGYTDTSVQRWIASGLLKGFLIKRRLHIPKLSLVGFLTSPYYHRIRVKSEKHKKTLQSFESWLLRHDGEVRR